MPSSTQTSVTASTLTKEQALLPRPFHSSPITMPTKRSIPQVTSPSKLAHIVLRTTDLAPMASFYKTFLGGHATHENDFISFITYDDEHHRIAILASPLTTPKVQGSAGLEHIAFTFPTLDDLVAAYQERKAHGIEPLWCVNHGPTVKGTTSMYYCDPDGNQIETQVDNFDDVEEAGRFMASKEFMENPIGTDFEPEDLIKRLKSGESHASIKKRIEIGPRSLPPGM